MWALGHLQSTLTDFGSVSYNMERSCHHQSHYWGLKQILDNKYLIYLVHQSVSEVIII